MLDNARLNKQRHEGLQLLQALAETGEGYPASVPNHPATLMWKGYEPALVRYITAICTEYEARGHKDNVMSQAITFRRIHFQDRPYEYPPWFGVNAFHENHRARLLEKDFGWYKKRNFGPTPPACGNLWPVTYRHGEWVYMEDGKVVHRMATRPTYVLVTEAMTQCSYCNYWWNRADLNDAGRCPTCVSLSEQIDMILELRVGDQEMRDLAIELAEPVRMIIFMTRQGRL